MTNDTALLIITTALVLTQIIRLIQIAIQLKRLRTRNDEVWFDLRKISKWVDEQKWSSKDA